MAFLYETPFLDLEIYRLMTILESSTALTRNVGRALRAGTCISVTMRPAPTSTSSCVTEPRANIPSERAPSRWARARSMSAAAGTPRPDERSNVSERLIELSELDESLEGIVGQLKEAAADLDDAAFSLRR